MLDHIILKQKFHAAKIEIFGQIVEWYVSRNFISRLKLCLCRSDFYTSRDLSGLTISTTLKLCSLHQREDYITRILPIWMAAPVLSGTVQKSSQGLFQQMTCRIFVTVIHGFFGVVYVIGLKTLIGMALVAQTL